MFIQIGSAMAGYMQANNQLFSMNTLTKSQQ